MKVIFRKKYKPYYHLGGTPGTNSSMTKIIYKIKMNKIARRRYY